MNSYQRWYEKNKVRARKLKREMMRRLRAAHPERYKRQSREYRRRNRERLFTMYGDVCALCGFSDKRALSLDHLNQDGNIERRAIGEYGVYRKALKLHDPKAYRILCMNCQFLERHKHDWLER